MTRTPRARTPRLELAKRAAPPEANALDAQPVQIEREGDVLVWRIARPHTRNALDWLTFVGLERAIAAASADPTLRAVVLTGQGSTFASGGDLNELRSATSREQAAQLADAGRHVCEGIARLRIPVIAALQGPAVGGGAELALACDVRIADPRATICFKHARLAVTTAWGVLPKLVSMVGHGTASRLLLTAHKIDAFEALRLRVIDHVAERDACVATAFAWAEDIAQGAPMAISELKALMREALPVHNDIRVRERDRFIETWTSADHREAVEAFFERRNPVWSGR
jgi:enoyl-CoA hydratase